MASPGDADRYEAYYAEKLWGLLPEIYRAADTASPSERGPLRELVDRIGAQAAILRRSIDRMWEDQSIETCDDWLIPYLGDLLATNLVGALDARGKRLDVARTIAYRRRKGTVAVLEQIAADISGWDARVVELFRRLARARHGLDPELGWPSASPDPAGALALQAAHGVVGPLTRSASGGFADLRSPQVTRLVGSAFDELSYLPDVRAPRERSGWYGIRRLGVFLWRLHSFRLEAVTPVQVAKCPLEYTFDATGRKTPLFAASVRSYAEDWLSPSEPQVPGPVSRLLLLTSLEDLYAAKDPEDAAAVLFRSIGIYREIKTQEPIPDGVIGASLELVTVDQVTANPTGNDTKIYIDPEQGLFFLPSSEPKPLRVAYHHGFSSTLGAGTYDRRARGTSPEPAGAPMKVVGGGEALVAGLSDVAGNGTVEIDDSLTYDQAPDVRVTKLTVRAGPRRRPLIRLPASSPSSTVWVFTGGPGSELVLDGVFVSGGQIALRGEFESVKIMMSTLDPGSLVSGTTEVDRAVDGRALDPCRLLIQGAVRRLTIDRCITGAIQIDGDGSVEVVRIQESIVQSIHSSERALSFSMGLVELDRTTVLGAAHVHRLEASSSILHQAITVAETQHGCLRFSAWAKGSAAPKQYESHAIDASAPIFTSLCFGDPGYAQLLSAAGEELAEGAADGSEMGAFSRERTAIKERSLRIKYQEYMPAGLTPVFIHVT